MSCVYNQTLISCQGSDTDDANFNDISLRGCGLN